jgi:hypothetical protein
MIVKKINDVNLNPRYTHVPLDMRPKGWYAFQYIRVFRNDILNQLVLNKIFSKMIIRLIRSAM